MEIKNYIFLITKNYNFSLLKMKTVDVVGKKWKVREVDKKFKNYILAIFRCEQMWFVECEQITFFKQKKVSKQIFLKEVQIKVTWTYRKHAKLFTIQFVKRSGIYFILLSS